MDGVGRGSRKCDPSRRKLVINPFASLTYMEKDRTLLGPKGEIYKKESPELLASLKKDAAEVFQKEYPTASIQ